MVHLNLIWNLCWWISEPRKNTFLIQFVKLNKTFLILLFLKETIKRSHRHKITFDLTVKSSNHKMNEKFHFWRIKWGNVLYLFSFNHLNYTRTSPFPAWLVLDWSGCSMYDNDPYRRGRFWWMSCFDDIHHLISSLDLWLGQPPSNNNLPTSHRRRTAKIISVIWPDSLLAPSIGYFFYIYYCV